ncbi:MAG TPA: hypothetical protein VGE74_26345 [Gemmata sp.]
MVGTLSAILVGLVFQLQPGSQAPKAKCITLLVRGAPQGKGELRPEAGIELRVKAAPNGSVIGRNLKPFISEGAHEVIFGWQLPNFPLIAFQRRLVTSWTGKVTETKVSDWHAKIPVDPKGFSTRKRVVDGIRVTEISYQGKEIKTGYVEAMVSFESQVTSKTINEFRVGDKILLKSSSTSRISTTFHLRVRHSTTTEWVYFDMLGNPDDDRLSRWHNPIRDGNTAKGKASLGWVEELVMTWHK